MTYALSLPSLSARQVFAELSQIVAASPDGSDTERTCKYADETGPHCIVGVWLFNHGVPVSTLRDFEGFSIASLILDDQVDVSPEAEEILARTQEEQDAGETWGSALESASRLLDFDSDDL